MPRILKFKVTYFIYQYLHDWGDAAGVSNLRCVPPIGSVTQVGSKDLVALVAERSQVIDAILIPLTPLRGIGAVMDFEVFRRVAEPAAVAITLQGLIAQPAPLRGRDILLIGHWKLRWLRVARQSGRYLLVPAVGVHLGIVLRAYGDNVTIVYIAYDIVRKTQVMMCEA